MARPAGVVRSSASVNETKPTPRWLQLLKCRNQIRDRPAPAIQTPDQYDIDFAAASGSEQRRALFALRRTRADLFDVRSYAPAALGGVLAHGTDLQGQSLLVVRGNASIQSDPNGVAKNLPRNRLRKLTFCGHFRRVAGSGQKLRIVVGLSLFQIVPRHPR